MTAAPLNNRRNHTPDAPFGAVATAAMPWLIDNTGSTQLVNRRVRIRQLLFNWLFTRPGERLFRPQFGAGAMALVFEDGAQVEQTLINIMQSSLTEELGDLIEVLAVTSQREAGAVRVTVKYRFSAPGTEQGEEFTENLQSDMSPF
jgi:phage baseplate assembly protein W